LFLAGEDKGEEISIESGNTSSVKNYSNSIVVDKSKRQRKSKKEENGRNYTCNICSKSYLSYPALYTHKRNKHNIIPITGKPEIFKTGGNTVYNKLKYNIMETRTNVKASADIIIKCYKNNCEYFYTDPSSTFFKKNFHPSQDSFLKLLEIYKISGLEKICIPALHEKEKLFVDNILAIYLILLVEITRETIFTQLVVKFIFLFREYLNLVGWDHFKYLEDFGLVNQLMVKGEFCSFCSCEELPEMVNDFVAVFLECDVRLAPEKKDMADIVLNLCNWLFINNLTNYKVNRFNEISTL
jgi:hypothetical protein